MSTESGALSRRSFLAGAGAVVTSGNERKLDRNHTKHGYVKPSMDM